MDVLQRKLERQKYNMIMGLSQGDLDRYYAAKNKINRLERQIKNYRNNIPNRRYLNTTRRKVQFSPTQIRVNTRKNRHSRR
jgi:hypothetical protein